MQGERGPGGMRTCRGVLADVEERRKPPDSLPVRHHQTEELS